MDLPRFVGAGRPLLLLVAIGLLTGAVGGLASGTLVVLTSDGDGTEERVTPTAQAERLPVLPPGASVVEVAERSGPAVVTIMADLAPGRDPSGRLVDRSNVGSGVIIDEGGFIIPNEHVVRDASRLTVTLSDGAERPASLVGDDRPFTDLAVLRIQPDGLTALPLGDSDQLALGETVVAIGSTLLQ